MLAVISTLIICVDSHITRDAWMISRHIDPEFMHTKAMHARAKAIRVKARLDAGIVSA